MGAEKRNGQYGKRIGILLITLAAMCCGCMAYRFQGTAQGAGSGAMTTPQGRYRIADFRMTVPRMSLTPFRSVDDPMSMPDPWSIPQFSYKRKTELIIRDLEQFIPSVFTADSRAEPIEVQLTASGDENWNGLTLIFPYLISLGIAPCWLGTSTRCDVTVTFARNRNLSRRFGLEYRSDRHLTAFSPFGLISYDSVPATSFRTGSGVLVAPHTDERAGRDTQDVFCETLAKGIAACLAEMEQSQFQVPRVSPPAAIVSPSAQAVVPAPVVPAAAPAGAPNTNPAADAAKLKQLRDAGTITQEEYEKMLLRAIEQKKE